MTDIKLCKDCKWYKKDWLERLAFGGDRFDLCYNPVLSRNLVTGKVKGGHFCDIMRGTYGGCGKEGSYWEARK